MKRSEMINKLLIVVTDYIPYEGPVPDYVDDLLEAILTEVEEAGMTPPFYDKIQDNNGEKVLIPAREWEDE